MLRERLWQVARTVQDPDHAHRVVGRLEEQHVIPVRARPDALPQFRPHAVAGRIERDALALLPEFPHEGDRAVSVVFQ